MTFDSPTVLWNDTVQPWPDYAPAEECIPGPLDIAGLHVELGYYAPGYDVTVWDVAEWDSPPGIGFGSQWEDAPPLVDVSDGVLSVSWTQGRDQPLDRFRTGTCTVVVDDPEGALSPWSGPDDHNTGVRPGIDLLVTADVDGVGLVPRFRGVVDSITDTWDPAPGLDAPHRVTFRALDYLQDLAVYDGTEQPATGAGELTGARIVRVLANAGYTRTAAIDDGTVTVQPTTLAGPALDEVGVTTDTERGAFWCDRAGVLQFRDRNGLVGDPAYTTVQAVFGEEAGEVCYSGVGLVADAAKVRNVVTISRAGGTATTHIDQESVALYGRRTFRRLDLIHDNDAESDVIADEQLDTFAHAQHRVEALRVDLLANPADLPVVVLLDVLHLIELRRRSRGVQVVTRLQVQSITETVTPNAWTLDFRTFDASTVFAVARWDTAAEWDLGLWGY